MAIPTGSFGLSWRGSALPIEIGAPALALDLPVTYSVIYEAPTGLYAQCVGDFVIIPRAGGFSSTSISLRTLHSFRDVQHITWDTYTTTAPGLLDTIRFFLRKSLRFGISGIEFHHKHESGSFVTSSRHGLLILSSSSTPHMSIDALNFVSDIKVVGDAYLVPPGQLAPRGFKVIDMDAFGNLYTGSFVTALKGDTLENAEARFLTLDRPTGSIAALKGVVVNRELVTLASGGIGALFKNATWGGGFFMPDTTKVSVFGTGMNFLVPSGSVMSPSLQILSGTLNVLSGSIYLRGRTVSFSVSGTSGSAYINGQPWSIVSVSNAINAIDTASGTPPAWEGTLVLIPSASTSNLLQAYLRVSGSWWTILSSSLPFPILDGGLY